MVAEPGGPGSLNCVQFRLEVMVCVGVGPPGLGDFGDVGKARQCFNKMAARMDRLKQIEDMVGHDTINWRSWVGIPFVIVDLGGVLGPS